MIFAAERTKAAEEAIRAEQAAERRRAAERLALEQAIRAEQAAEEWARQQVQGTREALLVRSNCESLGAALWHAGAHVDKPPSFVMDSVDGFEMLLANSTAHARADEDELHAQNDDAFACCDELPKEYQYDDVAGYVNDFCSAKAQRHAAHGAPRRLRTEKAWVAGERMKARAPARARQQKQALRAGARQSIADTRRLRTVRHTTLAARSPASQKFANDEICFMMVSESQ